MDPSIRAQVDWEQPFPHEEYAGRHARLREALRAVGLSGIFVTNSADLNYLFGYDQIWFCNDVLSAAFLPADDDAHVFFDNDGHEVLISILPEITDICYFPRGPVRDQIEVIVREVARRGWARGRIGFQPRGYGAHPDHVRAIGKAWEERGAAWADATDLIEDVRLIKSPREIEVVREAARIAVAAMSKARDSIAEGMRETELDGIICAEMMRLGGGHPGLRTMIGAGPRAGVHHEAPSHRAFRRGDVVHIDFCASLHRYHVNICRCFALGEVDPRWVDLFERTAPMMEVIAREVRPGQRMDRMDAVAREFARAHDLERHEWLIGGYTLGIAMPPDWVGRHRPKPREDIPPPALAPGLVMNFENQYDTYREGWSGAPGAGLIDTLLMSDDGFEILTPLARTLDQVG